MSFATLPTGQSDARYSTTIAVAETKASTMSLTSEVQKNADKLHTAVTDAAYSAEFKEPKPASAVGQLEQGLSQKTNVAVSQGAQDIESAKAAASSYVKQAKTIAGNVLSTAQSYVSGTGHPSAGVETGVSTGGTTTSTGISATVQAAIEMGKEYFAFAQAAAQPYIKSATSTAHMQAEKVKSAASSTQGGAAASGKPSDLKSGPHSINSPYPEPPRKIAEL